MNSTLKQVAFRLEHADIDHLDAYCREHSLSKTAVITVLMRSLWTDPPLAEAGTPGWNELAIGEMTRRHQAGVDRRRP